MADKTEKKPAAKADKVTAKKTADKKDASAKATTNVVATPPRRAQGAPPPAGARGQHTEDPCRPR